MTQKFRLSDKFVEEYKDKPVKWGFGDLSIATYKRTYARKIEEENRNEEWFETVRRVVEGTFTIQKDHCIKNGLEWNNQRAQKSAKIMYDKIFNFKFTPPGRGLSVMGTEVIEKKGAGALFNCSAVSTKSIDISFSEPFCYMMDFSMLGVGVGFDTRGAGKVVIKERGETNGTLVIDDSREGWVEALRVTLNSYMGEPTYKLDYSKIRPRGDSIKTFGGVAPGSEPLRILCEEQIPKILNPLIGDEITSVAIVDLMNAVGKAVVSGNVRRSAQLALGEFDDEDFIEMKDYRKYANELSERRNMSNNSVFGKIGMDYTKIANLIAVNGEPGIIWLQNVNSFGRFSDGWDDTDEAILFNPCLPRWSNVLTPDGIKQLADVKIGDKIWSSDDKWVTITNKWSTGIKQVYKYTTRAGDFYSTENHRVLQNGEKVEVADAESIDTSQYVEYMKEENLDLDDIMAGLLIGDGTIHKASNNLVLLCIGENDKDYLSDPVAIKIKKARPGIGPYVYEVETNITYDELAILNKRQIPDRYFYTDKIKIRGFLRGLFSANGSVVKNRVTLKSSNLVLINQVQQMLSSIGIKSYYTINKPCDIEFNNGVYTCKESYDLNISTDRYLFAQRIGFIQKYKMDKLNSTLKPELSRRGKESYEILDSELSSLEEVFDITVDGNHHTFWCNGFNVSNCVEACLEDRELCNLCELYPARHESPDEFIDTIKYAFMYSKTVTLIPTHDKKTNAVIMKNRRIGISMTGIEQAITKFGKRKFLIEFCDLGYRELKKWDKTYSNWLGIPRSKRLTVVKPSGSVSLLAGATPGIHKPIYLKYIRYVKFDSYDPLLVALEKAGYIIEDDFTSTNSTSKFCLFPVEDKTPVRYTEQSTNIWEQFQLTADMQKWWADQSVSVTIKFSQDEVNEIKDCLETYEDQLKSVSLLSKTGHGYIQAPYTLVSNDFPKEEDRYKDGHRVIWTEKEFEEYVKKIKPGVFEKELKNIGSFEAKGEKYCNNDICTI